MQQDFNQSAAKKTNSGIKLTIITLLIVALITTGFIYIKNHKTTQKKPAQLITATTNHKKNQHHYDFYTLLSKSYKPDPQQMQSLNKQSNAQLLQPSGKYFLQVAATKSRSGAKQLQNKLGAIGINSQLRTEPAHPSWTLILAGPYASQRSAKQDQYYLSQRHLNSLLISYK
jgi:cell division protein FtsN